MEIAGEGLTEIAQQVKAIGHLDGVRCALCRASRIVRGAITRNDFHPWMVA